MVDTELLINVRFAYEQAFNNLKQSINSITQSQATIIPTAQIKGQQDFYNAAKQANDLLTEQESLINSISDVAEKSGIKQKEREIQLQNELNKALYQMPDVVLNMPTADFKRLEAATKTLNQIGSEIGTNSALFKQQKLVVANLNSQMGGFKLTEMQLKKLRIQTKGFNWDFMSLMFFGMILQRTFGGAYKSIIDNYKKIVGLNSEFTKSVMKLNANWSYLKFSIANALNSPTIVNAIEWFSNAIERVGDYFADHPGMAQLIIDIIAALAGFGTVLIIGSAWMQWEKVFDFFQKKFAALVNLIPGAQDKLNDFAIWLQTHWKSAIAAGLNLTGLGFSIDDLIKNLKKEDYTAVVADAFSSVMFGAGFIAAMKNKVGVSLGLALLGGIALALNKIQATPRAKRDIMMELGYEKPEIAVMRWFRALGIGLYAGAETLLGNKLFRLFNPGAADALDRYKNDQINSLAELKANYKKYSEDIANYTIQLADPTKTTEQVDMLTSQLAIVTRAQEQAMYDGLTINQKEFQAYIDSLDAKQRAEEINSANKQTLKDRDVANQEIVNNAIDTSTIKVKELTDQMTDASVVDMFKNIDMVKLQAFKDLLDDIKIPIAEFNTALSSEKGLYLSLLNITNTLTQEMNIVSQLTAFNLAISNGNDILPTYTKYLDTQTTSMTNLARETNSAAQAQERLNAANGGITITTKTKTKEDGKKTKTVSTTTLG